MTISANAVAGALVGLDLDRNPALARQTDMLTTSGSPLPLPQRGCRTLVATLVIDVKSGMAATVYLMTMLAGHPQTAALAGMRVS